MKLIELFTSVKERNLSKDQLEEYRDQLANLFAEMQLELADIEKLKAIFFVEQKEKTDIATKRKWQITKEGQREIELSRYCKGTEKILSSLKARLYSLY